MTPADFKNWRKGLSMTQQAAADELGVTKRTVQLYEAGDLAVTRTVALACAALSAGLRPVGDSR